MLHVGSLPSKAANKWLGFLSGLGRCRRGTFSGQCFQINKQSFATTTYLLSEEMPGQSAAGDHSLGLCNSQEVLEPIHMGGTVDSAKLPHYVFSVQKIPGCG